jgi:hypothetical protein
MKAKQYKKIILKTLQQSSTKFRSIEDLADFIISKMEDYEEMASMLAEDDILSQYSHPTKSTPLIITGSSTSPVEVSDISERVTVRKPEIPYTDDEIIRMKEKAIEQYNRELPSELSVTPPNFKEPLRLLRRIMNSPMAYPFIQVTYYPHNSNPETDSCKHQVVVTGAQDSSEFVLDQIKKQAMAIYSSTPRRIEPRLGEGKVAAERLVIPNIGPGSWGAEIDKDTSGSEWGASSAELAASKVSK